MSQFQWELNLKLISESQEEGATHLHSFQTFQVIFVHSEYPLDEKKVCYIPRKQIKQQTLGLER